MIEQSLDMLGFRAKDKVGGFEGVITSVSFDLYGCVQLAINPGTKTDGKLDDCYWFDVQRIEITSDRRVIERPHFEAVKKKPAEYSSGAAEKPRAKS